ncbi:MAG: leucyl aminopeptidase family protein [Pseudomonadota bacterium]
MPPNHSVPVPKRSDFEDRLALADGSGTPVHLVTSLDQASTQAAAGADALTAWAEANRFVAKTGQTLLLPDTDGSLGAVYVGADTALHGGPVARFSLGTLPANLPDGHYHLASMLEDAEVALTGFLLGNYRFEGIGPGISRAITLAVDNSTDRARAITQAMGVLFGRDLINTPANLLGPVALGEAAKAIAEAYGAECHMIVGDDLLDPTNPFPLVHTVGAAANEAPRLVDMHWNGAGQDAPSVTLVGKGVCFDTGGLNLKPGNAMSLMKKDMGGAAAVLGLALMIMEEKLPIRLRVLVPIVENSVASPAFRPGDILTSRKGLTVEVGNTDAEGRLILADALALADEEEPDLLIDMATLTGAARVALGPDLPPLFTDDESLANELTGISHQVDDPVWRLPLWPRYEQAIKGKVADISNTGSMPFAGAITAALFLKRFVEKTRSWAHLDIYGWNPSTRPGRPEGGEPQAIRALFNLLRRRYGPND